ncbi:hypothetical protein TomMM35A_18720 [Sphingobium sp. TomMM35A]
MPWGARVSNASTGSVQIDNSYRNLGLLSKFTITTNAAGYSGIGRVATFLVSMPDDEAPVVGFSCSDDFAFFDGVTRSGNDWTFRIGVGGTSGYPDRTFTIYVFGRPQGSVAPGWGMRVRDASGRVTFDSRFKYMKVHSVLTGSYGTANPPGAFNGAPYGDGNLPSLTMTAGRSYCVLCSRTAHYVWNEGTGQGWEAYCLGVKIAGSALSTANLYKDGGFGANYITTAFIDRRDYNLVVLDVTNL